MPDPGSSSPDGIVVTFASAPPAFAFPFAFRRTADYRWFDQTPKSSLHCAQSRGSGRRIGIAMILRRYLMREALVSFTAVLSILMLVVVAARFASYLAEAAAGEVSRSYILELVALKCVDALTPLLPASVFAALVLALRRLERDHELVAMAAGGLSRTALAGTVLALGVGFSLTAGALSLAAAPVVSERYESLKAAARDSADVTRIVSGRFTRFGGTGPVFYVERIAEDGHTMERVFMHAFSGAADEVVFAPRARYVSRPGGRFVVLEGGRRYVGVPGEGNWTITRFGRYTVRLREAGGGAQYERPNTVSTARLWSASSADRSASAELQWRLSQPVLTLVLAGAAFAFSFASRGRTDRLAVGALFYLVYLGLVVGAAKGVESGHLPPWIGVWPVHGAFAAAVALLCLRLRRPLHVRTPASS